MYYDPKECGKRIKELRNLHQFTQEQLSERLNISLSMMSKLEQGTKSISVDLAIEIAEYFSVSLDYLLLGKGMRPVVVIQNNTGNKHAPTLIVAMVTTKSTKKENLPTHYLIKNNEAFSEPSVILLEQIRTIDKKRIKSYLGKTTKKEMLGIDKALLRSLSLNYLICIKEPRGGASG